MTGTPPTDDQAALWNGTAGHAWVEARDTLDRMFQPIEDLMVERTVARSKNRVLDVGCGTGATTSAIARRVAANGRCVGIDISAPMIDAARARAERENNSASFICADAQRHAFEPGSFDAIVSRFGVMFFDDPVRAFKNLRTAASEDADVFLIVWRSPSENPFMTTAERAAAPLLPNLPTRKADAPGQFAFADHHRVGRIFQESGWSAVDSRAIDVECSFPEAALNQYLTRFGPLGRVMPELDDRTRTQVAQTVRRAFEPYVHGSEVHFTAACWILNARVSEVRA